MNSPGKPPAEQTDWRGKSIEQSTYGLLHEHAAHDAKERPRNGGLEGVRNQDSVVKRKTEKIRIKNQYAVLFSLLSSGSCF
jgi:hypothetical protein